MSSMISSQGLVLATAMVVSSTVIYLTFSKQKTMKPQLLKNQDPRLPSQKLRSCLCSGVKEGKDKKKKREKRVQFAENVKETKGNGEEYRREKENLLFAREEKESLNSRIVDGSCRNETQGNRGMPANRVALYSGILRDRVHRMQCSH
uniref:Transmembrane protein n=1 Tax=Rhizophora mucronata TaxID=61149 RepID=A0A2P2PQB5_RHIMU